MLRLARRRAHFGFLVTTLKYVAVNGSAQGTVPRRKRRLSTSASRCFSDGRRYYARDSSRALLQVICFRFNGLRKRALLGGEEQCAACQSTTS